MKNQLSFDIDIKNKISADKGFNDVQKQEAKYGIPYQGNKSRIADIIINILPKGKRLVDLFGGGGAITHCAMLSGKWEKYLYNDINPLITQFFADAVNGKYKNESRVITRKEFEALKDTDPYAKYIWSFGNDGETYLWGSDIEEIKCQACRMLMAETLKERRLEYRKFIKMLNSDFKNRHLEILQSLQSLERLQSLESLQRLERLESLERLQILQSLEITNIDYRDYEFQNGDVVYCDIPYEQANKKSCNDYGIKFNSIEFYEWVKKQPFQIFFSSYEISDNSFYKIKLKEISQIFGSSTNSQKTTEYLYSNFKIEI